MKLLIMQFPPNSCHFSALRAPDVLKTALIFHTFIWKLKENDELLQYRTVCAVSRFRSFKATLSSRTAKASVQTIFPVALQTRQ
jgi:hypothetical protein